MCYEVAQCDKLTHLFCLCVVDSLNNGKAAIRHLKKNVQTYKETELVTKYFSHQKMQWKTRK